MGKKEKNKDFEVEIIGGEDLTETEATQLSKYFSEKKTKGKKKANSRKKEKA